MTHSRISKNDVIEVANWLYQQTGSIPSAYAIRKHLRAGSYNTIQTYLDHWKTTRNEITTDTAIPADVIAASHSLWKVAAREAQQRNQQLEAQLQHACEEQQDMTLELTLTRRQLQFLLATSTPVEPEHTEPIPVIQF